MTDDSIPPTETPDGDKAWNDWYWKQFEQIKRDIDSGADNFDKSMLTLSSGALAVSLAFIKDIVPLARAAWILTLLFSWVAFALCIVTTVVSFLFSIEALKKQRILLDEMLSTKDRELEKSQTSGWSTAVRVCTRVALTLFLVGLALTMIFVVKNVGGYQTESAKTADTPTVSNVRNFYMSDSVEKVVVPHGLEKGRQPAKLAPPPKSPVAPAPCPAKP
jgi:hypothetical protein